MCSIRICFIAAVVIGLNACSRGTDNPPPAEVASHDSAPAPVSPPEAPVKSDEATVPPAAPPPETPAKSTTTATTVTPPPVTQPATPRAAQKVAPPVANAPIREPIPAPVPAPIPVPQTTKSDPAPAAPISLDLVALEKKLKATKAIGVFSKIALKNQVDDLMKKFRDHYKGKSSPNMAELRQSYDLLMMKVLSMVQDDDKNLAAAIVSSRMAIWDLLADPQKFAALDA